MDEKICVILPYEELFTLANECKKEKGLNLKIKKGNLEEALPLAAQAQRDGADVIISRGGTATVIKKHVNIPVVEIKVSYLDILRVLYPYNNNDKTILVIGYQNVVNGCTEVSKILGIPIKKIEIPNQEQEGFWEKTIQEIKALIDRYNIRTIVGDTIGVEMTRHLCEDVKLITSGKDSIFAAIDDAYNVLKGKLYEKENSKRFKAILDFINDGVIAIDDKRIITVFNPTAERMFEIQQENAIGRNIDELIKENIMSRVLESKNAELEQIYEAPRTTIMINQIPLDVEGEIRGVVSTFQEVSKIQGAEQKIRENLYSKGFVTRYSFSDILTVNPILKKIIQMAMGYAKTNATILIEGESGTGKEVFAQSIHSLSIRAKEPFVAVNCAALPPQLLESELFGYVEGAFTGAAKGGKMGLFEMAHNGTIFLDEIGDMDKVLQARFLRVLEEKQIMRVGSDKIVPVNVRVIAATNVNLKEQVLHGKFRPDLFYRLNVLNLHLIPLRDRIDDIEYLAKYFIRKSNKKYGTQVEELSLEVLEALKDYSWPGNVRELKNLIERIVLAASRDYVTVKDIELIINELKQQSSIYGICNESKDLLAGSLKEIKHRIITKVLKEEGYNKSKAAKRLEIDRSTLDRILE